MKRTLSFWILIFIDLFSLKDEFDQNIVDTIKLLNVCGWGSSYRSGRDQSKYRRALLESFC